MAPSHIGNCRQLCRHMSLSFIPNRKQAELCPSHCCFMCEKGFLQFESMSFRLLTQSILFCVIHLTSRFSFCSLYPNHLNRPSNVPTSAKQDSALSALSEYFCTCSSLQFTLHSVTPSTCKIWYLLNRPYNHKDLLYSHCFLLPRDEVTLMKAFRKTVGCEHRSLMLMFIQAFEWNAFKIVSCNVFISRRQTLLTLKTFVVGGKCMFWDMIFRCQHTTLYIH